MAYHCSMRDGERRPPQLRRWLAGWLAGCVACFPYPLAPSLLLSFRSKPASPAVHVTNTSSPLPYSHTPTPILLHPSLHTTTPCPRVFLPHPPRDKHRGFQLYQSDPSGNYGGWKATAIGANHQAATNVLQGDFKEELSLEEVGGCVGWQHCVVQAVVWVEGSGWAGTTIVWCRLFAVWHCKLLAR